ncbi:MAG: hypothetical protein VXW04_03200 [Bacteroidota bacterium]|nr:hypothetical protein [Bacteroidota bacterium]
MRLFPFNFGIIFLITANNLWSQTYTDIPFLQDYSIQYEKQDSTNQLIGINTDRNKNIQVVSSKGLLSPWEKKLKTNFQYRPLLEYKIQDITVHDKQFYYLTNNEVFSFAYGGDFKINHGLQEPVSFSIGKGNTVFLVSKNQFAYIKKGTHKIENFQWVGTPISVLYYSAQKNFLILTRNRLYQFNPKDQRLKEVYNGNGFTSMEIFQNDILIGTTSGIYFLNQENWELKKIMNQVPCPQITALKNIKGSLWAGSAKGAFKLREDGKFDYYASKRWLLDDHVIDISDGPDQSILILTQKGLSKITFKLMTLESKAAYFQEIQRKRHIRYGLESAVKLNVAGDLSTATLIDTDNDGLWTSMYLASELFRYAATGSKEAQQNAYEALVAMERLTTISGIPGFPARTYEIDQFQISNWNKNSTYGVWKKSKNPDWVWKTTTSSDESCGHFFVYALFVEIIEDREWKNRAINLIKKQMDHIIENKWYLVSWDGKPTRWGRWNPDYVNSFPIQVGDRRLNSTLILSFLQTAYHFTQDEKYKNHALELGEKYGYEENATRSAKTIGYVADQLLSDAWNHSDDEMYFLTAPAFVKYALDQESKKKHLETVRSHWEIERSEKNPLWNFLYSLSGGSPVDLDASIWWLKEFPLDLLDWKVENKNRKDIIKIPANFRKQEYIDVLPPDERPIHLHNRAYQNNGGSDGFREYSPYVYLLPYWAGRYLNHIEKED